jgi:hypothetical protein
LTDIIDARGLDGHFHDATTHQSSQPSSALKHGPWRDVEEGADVVVTI